MTWPGKLSRPADQDLPEFRRPNMSIGPVMPCSDDAAQAFASWPPITGAWLHSSDQDLTRNKRNSKSMVLLRRYASPLARMPDSAQRDHGRRWLSSVIRITSSALIADLPPELDSPCAHTPYHTSSVIHTEPPIWVTWDAERSIPAAVQNRQFGIAGRLADQGRNI